MSFIFEGLLGCAIILAGIYFFLAIYVYFRLVWLQKNSSKGLNTRKLFVMTCLLTALLRFMSFSSMLILDLARIDFHVNTSGEDPTNNFNDDDGTGNSNFFEKALIVLFDFPDFSYVSAYLLLFVIWAETYLESRRHWLSNYVFRRRWLFTYFILNLLLYLSQLALYSLLFIPSVDEYVESNLIYLTLSAFSILLPMIWLMIYVYLIIQVNAPSQRLYLLTNSPCAHSFLVSPSMHISYD